MRAAILVLALAAAAPAPAPPAILAVSGELAAEVGPPPEGRRGVALAVEAPAPALAAPVATALAAALGARGYAVVPLRAGPDAEPRARAAGADWLVHVSAGLVPGRREVALVAEVIPAWPSFFLQRTPGARAIPPRVVQARAEADPETLLLARPLAERGVVVRPLARLPGRVLALAAGDAGDGTTSLLTVAADEATLLSGAGEVLARRALDAPGRRPVRWAAATAAIGDLGAGRIGWAVAGAPSGEVAVRRGERLDVVATPAAAPLCAGGAGPLFGAFAEGEGILRDVLSRSAAPAAAPRSARALLGAAAAPAGGPIAFAALRDDLRLELLGPDLSPAAPALAGEGAGFALADLDGDGTPEVVASSPAAGAPDRVRVLAPRPDAAPLFASGPLAGRVLAGAAGDLTGDGVDDAVLALWPDDGGTVLLLVTSDAREAR
jgi:hypothetical protein